MIEHHDDFFPKSEERTHTKPSATHKKITMSYDNVPPLPEHIAQQLVSQKHEMEKYESHPMFLFLDVRMNGDVEGLWDTGCVITRVCAETIGFEMESGNKVHRILTFKYVP